MLTKVPKLLYILVGHDDFSSVYVIAVVMD